MERQRKKAALECYLQNLQQKKINQEDVRFLVVKINISASCTRAGSF